LGDDDEAFRKEIEKVIVTIYIVILLVKTDHSRLFSFNLTMCMHYEYHVY